MAGKIKQIWQALSACFEANAEPLTSAQVVAWIGVHYPDNDFNPVTLKAQLYRSCANVAWAGKYNTPKIIVYDQRTKTYTKADEAPPGFHREVGQIVHGQSDLIQQNEIEFSDSEDQSDLLVGVEAQLRDYLAKNLAKLEKGLTFWTDAPPSVEFVIGGRRIDILAKDAQGTPVVVELKRGRAYDRVVGQALLYQALVARKFEVQRVRAILVASEISKELQLACSRQADFKLYEYELSMKLNVIDPITTDFDD